MKWSGAIRLEKEWLLVEVHTGITNMRKQVDEIRKERENK
jgi:hypothetical protein